MTARVGELGGIVTFSGVSANRDGAPFVTIHVLDPAGALVVLGQTDPESARAMALNLLAAAEAAESDAAVFRFLTTEVAVDVEGAAVMIGALRTHREELGGTP